MLNYINWSFVIFLFTVCFILFIPTIIIIIAKLKLKKNSWVDLYYQHLKVKEKLECEKDKDNSEEIKKEQKLVEKYEYLIDFSNYQTDLAKVNLLASFFFNIVIGMIILFGFSDFTKETKQLKNWNHTIKYYHQQLEYPTVLDIVEAEKINKSFSDFSFYKEDYIQSLPKINTYYLWSVFLKNSQKEHHKLIEEFEK